jgi:hypothetical protein
VALLVAMSYACDSKPSNIYIARFSLKDPGQSEAFSLFFVVAVFAVALRAVAEKHCIQRHPPELLPH